MHTYKQKHNRIFMIVMIAGAYLAYPVSEKKNP